MVEGPGLSWLCNLLGTTYAQHTINRFNMASRWISLRMTLPSRALGDSHFDLSGGQRQLRKRLLGKEYFRGDIKSSGKPSNFNQLKSGKVYLGYLGKLQLKIETDDSLRVHGKIFRLK